MSYIGIAPSTAAFPFDQFSGNGTTTAFTMSYAPASTTSMVVCISGVVQNPNTYGISGLTLTFSAAPPTGTNNIGVLYLGIPATSVTTPGNTAYLSSTQFTATAGQTTFTPSGTYQTGFVNVIRNGSQLAPSDYTATNGTTVVLANACVAGDVVVVEVYNLVSVSNALPLTGGTVTGATTFNSTVTINGGSASGYTGYKNRIINGEMKVAQRGTSFSTPANGAYTLDRWYVSWTGAAPATIAQVSGPTGFSKALQITGATSNTVLNIGQRIEAANCSDLIGQTVTIQANIAVSSSQTIAWNLVYANAADNFSSQTLISSGTWSATSTATTFTASVTNLPSGAANGLQLQIYPNNAGAFTSGTLTITGVQLERGSNATSFEFRDYGRELAMCQRYYFQYAYANTDFQEISSRVTTTIACITVPTPVAMRTAPALALGSSPYGRMVAYDSTFVATVYSVTGISYISATSTSSFLLGLTHAACTYAAGAAGFSFDTLGATSPIGLNAEL